MPVPAIGLIPLDDRPCNRVFPTQLAEVVGAQLDTPPREVLGWYTQPGDCGAVAEWLRQCPAQHLIVALDMLCYGGLVASRTNAATAQEAMERLEVLRAAKRSHPGLRIHAFTTITRLGTTVTSDEDATAHELLRQYSQLVDRVERLGEETARFELDAVLERLDSSRLADYLEMRRRNHDINRAAIQLVADDVVDYLVLAQEDAAPVGIHVPEQLALRGQVAEYRLEQRVSIRPGADEVGVLLLARHCALSAERGWRMAVLYANEEGADVTPLFEDRPLRTTVEGQARDAGAALVDPHEADAVLLVHTPLGTQGDMTSSRDAADASGLVHQADEMADRVGSISKTCQYLGLADAAYCNGGDPDLIAALRRRGALGCLTAYAGWNTAANTVGTAISHLCLAALSDRDASPSAAAASVRFLASRLIDDYAYQSCVRRQAVERANASGLTPHDLGDAAAEVRDYIEGELQPHVRSLWREAGAEDACGPLAGVRASLPWNRLFEVDIELVTSRVSGRPGEAS